MSRNNDTCMSPCASRMRRCQNVELLKSDLLILRDKVAAPTGARDDDDTTSQIERERDTQVFDGVDKREIGCALGKVERKR